jgi:hypothetical protein
LGIFGPAGFADEAAAMQTPVGGPMYGSDLTARNTCFITTIRIQITVRVTPMTKVVRPLNAQKADPEVRNNQQ